MHRNIQEVAFLINALRTKLLKCLTLFRIGEQKAPNNGFFWSNSFKNEVTITSIIEMQQLTNVGRMTTPTI